jgi:uncharacterized protein (TIGR03083 family)
MVEVVEPFDQLHNNIMTTEIDPLSTARDADGAVNVGEMVEAEQRELLEVLVGLAVDDWDLPTLCGTWKVRDVVAHLISMNEAGPVGFLQATLSMSWFNSTAVRRRRLLTPDELIGAFERMIGIRGLGRVVPRSAMLVEVLVHAQDIRRPLGLPRHVPAERLRVLLPRCVSPASYAPGFGFTGGRNRARGLHLRATDLDWSWGSGPEVDGAAEALLMAVLGRRAVLTELSGEGVRTLEARSTATGPTRAEGP